MASQWASDLAKYTSAADAALEEITGKKDSGSSGSVPVSVGLTDETKWALGIGGVLILGLIVVLAAKK